MSSRFMIVYILLPFFIFACTKEDGPPHIDTNGKTDYEFPEGKITFSYPPLDLDSVVYLEPMGKLDGLPSDHGGAHHTQKLWEEPTNIPLLAMADGLIEGWGHYFGDYWVVIRFSTTVSGNYGHVGRFHGDLAEEFGPLQNTEYFEVNIPVKAGDTIGYVSPKSAFDIGILDEDVVLNYCYPEIYSLENRYCGLLTDYFSGPLKNRIISLSMRQSPPKMGEVDYDIKGKLVGTWIRAGAAESMPKEFFTIGYHHIFSDRIAISDGYYVVNPGETFPNLANVWLKNNRPKPDTIGPEHGLIKFECISSLSYNNNPETNIPVIADTTNVDQSTIIGTFLMEMMEPEVLKIEEFIGKPASEVSGFTDNARIYKRKP